MSAPVEPPLSMACGYHGWHARCPGKTIGRVVGKCSCGCHSGGVPAAAYSPVAREFRAVEAARAKPPAAAGRAS